MSAHQATVRFGGTPGSDTDLVLTPGKNLRYGRNDFQRAFSEPTSLEDDLLVVAAAVYACDLAFKRGAREHITRSIHLRIPVVNTQAFARLRDDLEHILYVLSHDNWTIEFSKRAGTPETSLTWPTKQGTTLLFSGGLDSLAAAVDLLNTQGPARVQFASHITGNQVTRGTQETLTAYLQTKYAASVRRVALRTGGINHREFPFPADQEREETQRTRSFMFLAIAAIAARRSGHNDVVMIAENGQMAIHLPLSAARIGAFSTHTAHPEFVHFAQRFFSTVLEHHLTITNPYVYQTKAEVVRALTAQHPDAIPLSVSCWRGSRVTSSHHCGDCVPCLVRRIALEANGVRIKEYARDLLSNDVSSLPTDDEGKRNLVDLIEFATTFHSLPPSQLEFFYPDVFSQYFDKDAVMNMYHRFSDEAFAVLRRYPSIHPLLPTAPKPPPAKKEQREPRS